jgi:hypothetical protein
VLLRAMTAYGLACGCPLAENARAQKRNIQPKKQGI